MILDSNKIAAHNDGLFTSHKNKLVFTASEIAETENIIIVFININCSPKSCSFFSYIYKRFYC